MVLAVDWAFLCLSRAHHQVFIESAKYLLKFFSCQVNIQFHWTRKLTPLTVVFLVSYQPRFHAALFKHIFRSTKVDFVLFTFTLYF